MRFHFAFCESPKRLKRANQTKTLCTLYTICGTWLSLAAHVIVALLHKLDKNERKVDFRTSGVVLPGNYRLSSYAVLRTTATRSISSIKIDRGFWNETAFDIYITMARHKNPAIVRIQQQQQQQQQRKPCHKAHQFNGTTIGRHWFDLIYQRTSDNNASTYQHKPHF